VKRPKNSDLIVFEWRDSHGDHAQASLHKHPDDCRWISVGWVVKQTDLFLTVACGVQVTTQADGENLDYLLSVPWTQVIDWKKVA
jgi:hypothetical protein